MLYSLNSMINISTDTIMFPLVIIAILIFVLTVLLANKDRFVRSLKADNRIAKEEALTIAENELLKKGIPLFLVDIQKPVFKKWKSKFFWSVQYKNGDKFQEILLAEDGKILRNAILPGLN